MQRSLSVLLPVRNSQSTLNATVSEVLEVASELAERFELVIVDDGSEDATGEVADELTRSYPQVKAVSHTTSLGMEEAIRSGLRCTSGDVVLLRDDKSGLRIDETSRVWQTAEWKETPRSEPGEADDPKLLSSNDIGRRKPARYRVLDRQTLLRAHTASAPNRPNYLQRIKRFALGE